MKSKIAAQNANLANIAFTLAEVLVTLAIIGVVAALTIPTLVHKYQEDTYFRKTQKARVSIGEAGRVMVALQDINGYANAKDFVENGLRKHLKITKMCDNDKLTDCKFPATIKTMAGTDLATPVTWSGITEPYAQTTGYGRATTNAVTAVTPNSHAFQTADGFSVLLFYNPYCVANGKQKNVYDDCSAHGYTNMCIQQSLDLTCFHAIYDSNGLKGPNEYGKDINSVTLLNNDSQAVAVAPLPYKQNNSTAVNFETAVKTCQDFDGGNGKWSLPNIDELSSMYNSYKLAGNYTTSVFYWSGSPVKGLGTPSRYVAFNSGHRSWRDKSGTLYVRCVRRN